MKTQTGIRICTVIVLFVMLFITSESHAQNYYINFSASGAVATLDSVKVENITKGTSLTLSGIDTLHLLSTIGINDVSSMEDDLTIFPNPAQGQAELSFYAANSGTTELVVFDLSGKEMLRTFCYLSEGMHRYRIANFSQGVYFICVYGQNYSHASKLLSLNTDQGIASIEYLGRENYEPEFILLRVAFSISGMAYTSGDTLQLTGFSGLLSSIIVDIPTSSKTITFIFTTIPSLTTTAVSAVTDSSAVSGGNVISDGGNSVVARGVCWGTSANPVVTGNHSTDGSGTGTFSSSMTGLASNTTYYVRAYATNGVGTGYGNELTFTTASSVTIPVLTTTGVTSITSSSAISGGNISSDGGSAVTARGVCWSTTTNPVSTGNHTNDGTGTGTFTSNLSSLSPGTVYYLRAYATNSVGTAYGNEVMFTTIAVTVAIGDSYQGGIVAYILQAGDPGYSASVQHGIIAAPTDQSAGIQWHNGSFVATGATATALGTGNANTTTIVGVQGTGSYAAQLCADLVLNGYSDWYLPSKDELNKLFLSKTAVGGYVSLLYWASTEVNANDAAIQSFNSGNQLSYGKNYLTAVRAIRAF